MALRRVVAILVNLLLVPGAGHVALGRPRRGVAWLGLTVALLALSVWWWGFLLAALVLPRVGGAVDAALVQPATHEPGLGHTILGVVVGAAVTIAAVIGLQLLCFDHFRIPAASMSPTLEIGDHIMTNKLAYRFGDPARGDVAVFSNPCEPEKDFVKRVVAVGGDTIEVRCDVVYLNGAAVPAELEDEPCHVSDYEPGAGWTEDACSRYREQLGGVAHEVVYSPERPERDRRRAANPTASYAEVASSRDFPGDRVPMCDVTRGPIGGASEPATGRIEDAATPPATACAPRQHYVVPADHYFVMGDNRDNSSDSRTWGPVPRSLFKGKATAVWWSDPPGRGTNWHRLGAVR